jgi:PAS domain S-box-containing protein
MAEMLGYDYNDVIDEPFTDFVDPADRDNAMAFFLQQVDKSTPQIEYKFTRKDGSKLWTIIYSVARFDENDNFNGALGIIVDITKRKELENQIIESSEHEKSLLAQELHDGLCQDLKSLEIEAILLEDKLKDKNDIESSLLAKAISEKANSCVNKAYQIAKGLLPAGLSPKNFDVALRNLIDQVKSSTKIEIVAKIDSNTTLNDELQTFNIYRIAQEALNNAVHHSKASKISLYWGMKEDNKTLIIADDGMGFDIKTQTSGMGLVVMNARAESIDATLEIKSASQIGTEVILIINQNMQTLTQEITRAK